MFVTVLYDLYIFSLQLTIDIDELFVNKASVVYL